MYQHRDCVVCFSVKYIRVCVVIVNGQMAVRNSLKRLPIQANFYPMSSELFIEDMRNRFTLLAGQAHGVANLSPGLYQASCCWLVAFI